MKRKNLALLAAAVVNSFLYLNCSGFKGTADIANFSSLTCQAKMQSKAEATIDISQCEKFENYLCERRIFSPSVDNASSASEFCGSLNNQQVCVQTSSLSFNTEPARSTASLDEFSDGGEFNREEFQCIYNLQGANTPLFQAQGDSVMSALSTAIELCQKRGSL